MSDYYELIGQTPVRIEGDILECARRFEQMGRQVSQTDVFGTRVSTVFLGLDHSFFGGGPPLLFETMAFWPAEGGYEQERCSTWLEAEEQHARICREVARPRVVLAYIGRVMGEWRSRAMRDLVRRWREIRGVEPSEMDRLFEEMETRILERGPF